MGGGILNRNAFTLIELLAIIVILAIIAVITVPIILNIIENSKKGAATDSAYGYKDAVNKYYINELSKPENQGLLLNGQYNVSTGGVLNGSGITNKEIPVSGDKPSAGELHYSNNELKGGCLVIGDYAVIFEGGNATSTTKGDCSNYEFPSEQGNGGNQQVTNPYLTRFDGTYTYGYKNVNLGSTSTLDPSWGTYLRNDGEKNELCVVFTGGTVCVEADRWDCGEVVNGQCSNSTGYIAYKKLEIESVGATCKYNGSLYCAEDEYENDNYWHQITLFTDGTVNSEYGYMNDITGDATGCWNNNAPACYESN